MANSSSTVEDDLGVSPFPHPPKLFYKLYTDENVKDGKSPLPPKPIQGTYMMFGAQFDVSLTSYFARVARSETIIYIHIYIIYIYNT